MRYIFLIIIVITIITVFFSCEEIEWRNPYDPVYLSSVDWAPKNLQIEILPETEVLLTWENSMRNISSFFIEKSQNNGEVEEIATTSQPNYFDYDLLNEYFFTYRVRVISNSRTSNPSNIARIVNSYLPLFTGDRSDIVSSVNFSPDNSKVISGSYDSTVTVWDAMTGKLLWSGSHSGPGYSANFSADNSKVVSSSEDKMVRVWNYDDSYWQVSDGD